jgi:hypothetical protein
MPGDLTKICEERARLLRDYSNAAQSYSERVREMADLALSGEEPRVGSARQNCRTAWDETEKMRLALYRHEADHQCDRGAEVGSVSGS